MSVAQQNNRDNRRIESRAGERTGSPTIDRIHEETKMNEPKEVFLLLLSNARHGTARRKIYSEISQQSQIPEVREVLRTRAFVAEKIVETLTSAANSLVLTRHK